MDVITHGATPYQIEIDKSSSISFAVFHLISLLPCLGTVVWSPVLGFTQMSCEAPCLFSWHPARAMILTNSDVFIDIKELFYPTML